jgi:hypothetical protein
MVASSGSRYKSSREPGNQPSVTLVQLDLLRTPHRHAVRHCMKSHEGGLWVRLGVGPGSSCPHKLPPDASKPR